MDPLPDFSNLPPTTFSTVGGRHYYHACQPAPGEGPSRWSFEYHKAAVPGLLLRTLWCCWRTYTLVELNCGFAPYSYRHQLALHAEEELWQPWCGTNSWGRISADSHGQLWIGGASRSVTVPIENVLAVRYRRKPDFPVLYEAPEYKKPVFELRDAPDQRTRYTLYSPDGTAVAAGSTMKFAVNHAARFGGSFVDKTGDLRRKFQVRTQGRRAVQLRKGIQ